MKISLSFPSPHRSNSSLFHHHLIIIIISTENSLSPSPEMDVLFVLIFFVNFNLSPLCIEKYFLRCFLSVFVFFSFFLLFPSIGNVCLLLFCRVSFEPLLFSFFSLNVFEFCSCCLKVLRRFMRRFLEDCPSTDPSRLLTVLRSPSHLFCRRRCRGNSHTTITALRLLRCV